MANNLGIDYFKLNRRRELKKYKRLEFINLFKGGDVKLKASNSKPHTFWNVGLLF